MSKKSAGLVVAAVGLLAALVSLLADAIGPLRLPVFGLWIGRDPGFGPQQTAGTVIGVVLIVVGIWLWRRRVEMSKRSAGLVLAALGLLGIVLWSLLADVEPDRLSDKDEAALHAQAESLEGVIRASDWSGFAGLFSDDAVAMPPNQPTVEGRAAIQRWSSAYTTWWFDMRVNELEGRDGLAYMRGTYISVVEVEGSSDQVPESGRYLLVWEKQPDGLWLIVEDIWNSDRPLPSDGSTAE